MILRAWIGPTNTSKAEARAAHERIVNGWKDAIQVAERANGGGYWPIHVDDEGNIVASLPPEPDLILGTFPPDRLVVTAVNEKDGSDKVGGVGGNNVLAEAVFESVEYVESHQGGGDGSSVNRNKGEKATREITNVSTNGMTDEEEEGEKGKENNGS